MRQTPANVGMALQNALRGIEAANQNISTGSSAMPNGRTKTAEEDYIDGKYGAIPFIGNLQSILVEVESKKI